VTLSQSDVHDLLDASALAVTDVVRPIVAPAGVSMSSVDTCPADVDARMAR
jgi:hypothetical protein